MIPLAPVPFAAWGTVCCGQLYFGLCRALVAPWLDPWWLARGRQDGQAPARPATARITPPPEPAPPASAPTTALPVSATVIPFDRSRAGARRRIASEREGQR